jgi:formate/nitrite transporter FocA (FNT family)
MNFGTVIAGIVMDFLICLAVVTNFPQESSAATILMCVGVVMIVRTAFKAFVLVFKPEWISL